MKNRRFILFLGLPILALLLIGGAASGIFPYAITSPSNGQVLTYNSTSSQWENKASSTSSGANPTGTISGTVGTFVNGSASTFLRSDGAPTLPATIAGLNSITSAALSNLVLGTGTFGTSVTFASATGIPTFATAVNMPTLLNLTSTSGTSAGGITFATDTNLYRSSAGYLTISGGGLDLTGASSSFRLNGGDAISIAAGVLTFNSGGLASVALKTNGTTALTLDSSQNATFAGDIWTINGNAGAPSQSFTNDKTTGSFLGSASVYKISTGGVLALTVDASQNATFAGNVLRFATTKGIQGSNTNDDVAAGYIGEYASTLKAIGSPVSLSNNTVADIISVTLTAGDWDVTGLASVTETTSTVTARSAGLTSTSATMPTDGSEGYNGVQSTVTSETNSIPLNRKRFSLTTTTTVYLDEKVTFSAGSAGGFGSINARRAR